ncbi:MAG: hypothetical protein MJ092_02680 [Lachnospiraceae bacterium]|nr:hypothetical protein [Lachnospiraceae bacterium]
MWNNETKKGVVFNLILSLALTVVFFLVVRLFYSFTYGVIDDPFIETVLSGAYTGTPDANVVYIKHPLAALLAFLYTVQPAINWHFGLLVGCFVVCAFLVNFRICSNVSKLLNKIIFMVLFLLLFILCLAKLFITAHYSMCAGVLVGTGIFYFLTIKYESSKRNLILNYIVSLLLLYLAYCLRARTLFMLMPIAFVAFLYKFFNAKQAFKKQNIIRWIIFPIVLFIGVGAIELVHSSAYKSDAWKEFLKFNDARTTLYDFYGVPDYEGNEEFYDSIGVEKERVFMYKDRYYLEFTDGMEDDMLEKIADYSVARIKEKYPTRERLGLSVKALGENLSQKVYQPMNWIAAGLALALIICCFIFQRLRAAIIIFFGKLAALVPWIYMIYMGKPTYRVTSGIWFAELLFLIGIIIDNAEPVREKIRRFSRNTSVAKTMMKVIIAALLAAAMLFGIITYYPKTEKSVKNILKTAAVRDQLQDWCRERPENLYILESDVIKLGFNYKTMNSRFLNFYYPGGWPSKMPQAKEKIWARYGIDSIESGIIENNQVYLVAFADKDMTYWTDFYRLNYPEAKLQKIETIKFDGTEFAIYQMQGK